MFFEFKLMFKQIDLFKSMDFRKYTRLFVIGSSVFHKIHSVSLDLWTLFRIKLFAFKLSKLFHQLFRSSRILSPPLPMIRDKLLFSPFPEAVSLSAIIGLIKKRPQRENFHLIKKLIWILRGSGGTAPSPRAYWCGRPARIFLTRARHIQ